MTTINLRLSCAISLILIANFPTYTFAEETAPVQPGQTESPAKQLFNEGSSLIKQGDLAAGVFSLKKAADKGNALAAFELASFYELGLGVPKDYQQARHYYEQAVQQGHRDAHFNLALLLTNGEAAFNDLRQSRNLMRVIAEKGDVEAQYTLAVLFKDTLGEVQPDLKTAFAWLQKAAQQGHAKAQFHLGLHYLKGEMVEHSAQDAFQWFSKAAAQNIPGAQFNLALMYEKGEGTTSDNKKALSWYHSAAELGNAHAQQNLGIKYLLGEQIKADEKKAVQLVTNAAQSGFRDSQFLLGYLYQFGHEGRLTIDLERAEQWYLKAAKQGHSNAQYHLALVLLENGKSPADAKFWIKQAATAGHKEALALQARL